MDTTEDITSKTQCVIVLRYMTDVINEKLIAVVECESSTGENRIVLLKNVLEKNGIDIKKCIGNWSDGAENMQGQYKGFSALLTQDSPAEVHVWCYVHILNFVLADTAGISVSASLFSIIALIGETRWWSKDQALCKVLDILENLR